MRNLKDSVYWYKHYFKEEEITKLYRMEIAILEAIRAHVIRFLDGVVKIGAERRNFSYVAASSATKAHTL